MWPIWGRYLWKHCLLNAIQVFCKVVKIFPNLEYGRQMKLDISLKVPPSLKQRESSLISIFKSCFHEGCRWGLGCPKMSKTMQSLKQSKTVQTAKLYFDGLPAKIKCILYTMDGERTVKYEDWLISSQFIRLRYPRCFCHLRWFIARLSLQLPLAE